MIADIEKHGQLSPVGKTTHFKNHIGGTWYVSVDNRFPTVDIHRWYKDSRVGSSLKPTRVGITLSYFNWEKLKKAIVEVEHEFPALLVVSPCWHESLIDQMFCDECSLFHKVEDVDNVRAAEAAKKLTINSDSSTSDDAVDFTQCQKMLRMNPLLSAIEQYFI